MILALVLFKLTLGSRLFKLTLGNRVSSRAALGELFDDSTGYTNNIMNETAVVATSPYSSTCAALTPDGTCSKCTRKDCSSYDSVVKLRIYRLSQETSINRYGHYAVKAVGAGGLFHVGVSAFGMEVSFGDGENGTGVYYGDDSETHKFHKEYVIGKTSYSKEQFKKLLKCLEELPEWKAYEYDMLFHNCVSFSKYVINTMFQGQFHNCGFSFGFSHKGKCCMPPWASRAARVGQAFVKAKRLVVEGIGQVFDKAAKEK